MNSQASRKVKASSASRTRFMPARKAGTKGSTRRGAVSPARVAERVEAGQGGAEIDHEHEEGAERVEPQVHSEPRET